MRAKEFIMKDAYSFDTTDEARNGSYQKMYDAYTRIFARCGLKAFPVEADTGVIGGKYSHEFMVPAETGENEVAFCEACGYAANIEKATSGIPKTAAREIGAAVEKFATPGVVTIEALSKEPYKVPANRQIKTLVYIADSKPVIVLIRGDDQLNETKLRMAKTGAVRIFVRPRRRKFSPLGAKFGQPRRAWSANWMENPIETLTQQILRTKRLRGANDMTTGANEDGFHLKQRFHRARHQGDGNGLICAPSPPASRA
jgi:prolyl-tRNA synthetase